MRRDVLDLRQFYSTPLGRAARSMITAKVNEAWGDVRGLDMLGMGYAAPYLDQARGGARRVVLAMPAQQGVEVWPPEGRVLSCLSHEAALPFPNALFDRLLMVHALEESENAPALLTEACRVLAPSGRLIVVAANRRGLWSNAETTPFGHGRPYTRGQLEALIREAELEPVAWSRALYVPPFAWTARWADGFEQVGARVWPIWSGLILMEAVKQTFAVKPRGLKAPARVFAPPILTPVPASPVTAPKTSAPGALASLRAWTAAEIGLNLKRSPPLEPDQ